MTDLSDNDRAVIAELWGGGDPLRAATLCPISRIQPWAKASLDHLVSIYWLVVSARAVKTVPHSRTVVALDYTPLVDLREAALAGRARRVMKG